MSYPINLMLETQLSDADVKKVGELMQRIAKLEDNADINRKSYAGLHRDYVKRGERIAELEAELAAYTAAEVNHPTTWPMIERQGNRIKELEAEITTKTAENISVMDELEQRDGLIAELEAEIERLREKVKIQGINLRLREIDGSMDVDALIKDAERYRWCVEQSPLGMAAIAWGVSDKSQEYELPDDAIDAAMEE